MQFYETNEIQLWGPKAIKKGCLFLLLRNEWNSWNINLWNSWNRWNKNLWNSWNTPPKSWKKIFQLLWNKHRLSLSCIIQRTICLTDFKKLKKQKRAFYAWSGPAQITNIRGASRRGNYSIKYSKKYSENYHSGAFGAADTIFVNIFWFFKRRRRFHKIS